MVAAHIFPRSLAESQAAYMFGRKLDEGYDLIWSEKNGLMLHKDAERDLDNGPMVIVPDPTEDNEFMCI